MALAPHRLAILSWPFGVRIPPCDVLAPLTASDDCPNTKHQVLGIKWKRSTRSWKTVSSTNDRGGSLCTLQVYTGLAVMTLSMQLLRDWNLFEGDWKLNPWKPCILWPHGFFDHLRTPTAAAGGGSPVRCMDWFAAWRRKTKPLPQLIRPSHGRVARPQLTELSILKCMGHMRV